MSDPNGVPFTVAPVRSEDPKRKDDKDKDKDKKKDDVDGVDTSIVDGKQTKVDGKKEDEEELSEEDAQLKGELEMLVERLKESDTTLYQPALESLRTLIRTATASMTSVPKPLKFLRPHYPELQELYEKWPSSGAASSSKSLFADILSVLAMTYSDSGKRETLSYRLKGGSEEDPGTWGHEYVRHLAAEIEEEYASRTDSGMTTSSHSTSELHALALRLVPFLLSHNGEADAVDLLLELESISSIIPFVDENTYSRVCLYMTSCVNLLVPPDDREFLKCAREIYRKFEKYSQAIVCSLRLGDAELIKADFATPKNMSMKRQLAYILARQQFQFEDGEIEDEGLLEILNNTKLTDHFQAFGKELNLVAPRALEDIYKSHLENTRVGSSTNVDSAKQNLAGTFVNAFVNAGFGNDKLMAQAEEGQSWIYKNKDHGQLSAAASLGLSFLWNPESGLNVIDTFTYPPAEDHIRAGAMLANGLIHSGQKSDVPIALLDEFVDADSPTIRVSAIMGIGIGHAGTARAELLDRLLPIVADTSIFMEISSMAALALGFIFVGTGNGDVTGTILQAMMEREEKELEEKWTRFMGLGLALLYLGQQDASDATIETLKAIEQPISKSTQILVDVCSYAGTGNVLKIQSLLHHCNDHLDAEKESDLHQQFAVLGIAVIAMGEDVGAEMSLRQFDHLMHYGEPVIRRAVPLALGLISASNPVLTILDTLSKYSHDNDLDVAINAIFAMGLVGAGTNNARLAQMLRGLASYYHKEPDCLFMVRVAQGIVHMGKGMIGLNPFHTDRTLMSPVAVAGLLATLTAFTDVRGLILDKNHWMLYFLTMGMYPRFLITFDEDNQPLPVSVRVGQAVDVVGQAGKPRTISGFQTHTTPVRLGHTERAELATEEFIPYTHVLENFAILAKNKGFEKEQMDL